MELSLSQQFLVGRTTIDHLESQYHTESPVQSSLPEIGGKGRARIYSRVLVQLVIPALFLVQVFMFCLIVNTLHSVSLSPSHFL